MTCRRHPGQPLYERFEGGFVCKRCALEDQWETRARFAGKSTAIDLVLRQQAEEQEQQKGRTTR